MYKRNLFDSDPSKIIGNGVEACFKILRELLKALDRSSKIFQKFGETRLLKKPKVSIHQLHNKTTPVTQKRTTASFWIVLSISKGYSFSEHGDIILNFSIIFFSINFSI